MSLTKQVCLLAGAATLSLTGGSFAGTTTGDQNLRAEVDALRAEVARLKAESGDNWLNEQRAGEIRSLVHDVLADADTRASLLQAGMTAGYDDGFVVAGADGNFKLKINGQIQFRFVYNNLDDELEDVIDEFDDEFAEDLGLGGPDDLTGAETFGDLSAGAQAELEELLGDDFADGELLTDIAGGVTSEDEHRWGFEMRRTKLIFSGHVVDPSWQYRIQGNFGRNGGDFMLQDAYIRKVLDNGWRITFGQFKAPLLREELVSSSRQLAVERSLVNNQFTADRTQGVMADYEGDGWHAYFSFNDGIRQVNSPWENFDNEWAVTGRGEFLLGGEWEQFRDFTSFQDGPTGTMVGVAAHYQTGEYGTTAVEDELWIVTADLSMEFGGANLFAAINYEDIDATGRNPWGAVVQGGWFFTEDWELFGRFEWMDFDYDFVDVDDTTILTAGVNRYYAGHALKWTTDVSYAFDAVWPLFASTGAGFRPDTDDGQLVFRTQLQLLF